MVICLCLGGGAGEIGFGEMVVGSGVDARFLGPEISVGPTPRARLDKRGILLFEVNGVVVV